MLYGTDKGLAVFSNRNISFKMENGFYSPDQFASVFALAYIKKSALTELALVFVRHRSAIDSIKAGNIILADQKELINIEQNLSFKRICDNKFGQRSYEILLNIFKIKHIYDDTKNKVNVLSEYVRDARASFYQRLAFWISFLFAPLGITVSFFSGVHLDKDFSNTYDQVFPIGLQAGWIQFILLFLFISIISGIIWIVIRKSYNISKILQSSSKKKMNKSKK